MATIIYKVLRVMPGGRHLSCSSRFRGEGGIDWPEAMTMDYPVGRVIYPQVGLALAFGELDEAQAFLIELDRAYRQQMDREKGYVAHERLELRRASTEDTPRPVNWLLHNFSAAWPVHKMQEHLEKFWASGLPFEARPGVPERAYGQVKEFVGCRNDYNLFTTPEGTVGVDELVLGDAIYTIHVKGGGHVRKVFSVWPV